MLTARRGGASTPRQPGLTNGHVNGVSSPGGAAAGRGSQAESPLFSSPPPRRGLLHIYTAKGGLHQPHLNRHLANGHFK